MEAARRIGIETEIELILPAEVEACPRQRVVAQLCRRMPLGEIGRVRGDLVGDYAGFNVVAVRQSQVLFRRDVAEHGSPEPADHGRADPGSDVVVAGRDVRRQRAERVEGGLAALAQLLVHVELDLVHRHMAGAFDHHLAALYPGNLRQFAERLQFRKLRTVVGVGDGARTQTVAQGERYIVGPHDVADLVEALVEKAFLVMGQAPLGHDGAAA